MPSPATTPVRSSSDFRWVPLGIGGAILFQSGDEVGSNRHVGVTGFGPYTGTWFAQVRVPGTRHSPGACFDTVGRFETEAEARAAVEAALLGADRRAA